MQPIFLSILIALWGARALGSAVHSASGLTLRRRRLAGRAGTRLGAAARGLHHGPKIAPVRHAHRRAFPRVGFFKSATAGGASAPSIRGGEGAGGPPPASIPTLPTMACPPLSTFT